MGGFRPKLGAMVLAGLLFAGAGWALFVAAPGTSVDETFSIPAMNRLSSIFHAQAGGSINVTYSESTGREVLVQVIEMNPPNEGGSGSAGPLCSSRGASGQFTCTFESEKEYRLTVEAEGSDFASAREVHLKVVREWVSFIHLVSGAIAAVLGAMPLVYSGLRESRRRAQTEAAFFQRGPAPPLPPPPPF